MKSLKQIRRSFSVQWFAHDMGYSVAEVREMLKAQPVCVCDDCWASEEWKARFPARTASSAKGPFST